MKHNLKNTKKLLTIFFTTLLLVSCKDNELKNTLIEYNKTGKIPNTNDCSSLKTNENFIDWSWHKFLWLTSTDEDGVLTFMKELKQVDDFAEEIKLDSIQAWGLPNGLIKDNKLPIVLDLYQQADGVHLKGKNNSITRYSIHANQFVINTITSAQTKSVIREIKDILLKKSANNAINNTHKYPVGATEIKIAWIKTSEVADSTKTYNITAIVNEISKTVDGDNKPKRKYENAKLERMSMIGFHIFTVTNEHPEGVWATFDQVNLAPNRTSFVGDPVAADNNEYTFFDKKGEGKTADGIIQNPTDSLPLVKNKLFQSYPLGVRYDKKAKGMVVIKNDEKLSKIINSRNKLVSTKLINDKVNIWSNYKLIGAIWSDLGKDLNDLHLASLEKPYGEIEEVKDSGVNRVGKSYGSFNLANVTMETTFQEEGKNCFSCHGVNKKLYEFGFLKDSIAQKIDITSPLITSHLYEKFIELEAFILYKAEHNTLPVRTNNTTNNLLRTSSDREAIKNYIRSMSRIEARELKNK